MRVTAPDLELWLTRYIRALAADEGVDVDVSNKEPADLGTVLPMPKPLIVIRDDSGAKTEVITFERSIGASVIGGSKKSDQQINDLGRWLAGILHDPDIVLASDDCPIAAVDFDGCNGPYPVAEQVDVARRYMTAQYRVVGSW